MPAFFQFPDDHSVKAVVWFLGTVVLVPLCVKAFLYLFRKAFLQQFEELIGFMRKQELHNQEHSEQTNVIIGKVDGLQSRMCVVENTQTTAKIRLAMIGQKLGIDFSRE